MACSHNHMKTAACIPREVQFSPPADHTGVGPTILQPSVSLPSIVPKRYHPALCEPKTLCWKL